MTRDLLVFSAGLAVGALLAFGAYLLKKADPFGPHPDRLVHYRTVDGHELGLHVFDARTGGEGARPALLLFHGGAWQVGSAHGFYAHCAAFARAGLTCISAEYRVTSRHGTDARDAVQDARAAWAYVQREAAGLGLDPARIAVGGGSSGGHLAAALGIPVPLPAEPGSASGVPRPAAMILYNPMIDLSPCRPDHHLVTTFWRDVSPMQQIDGEVPPTLVLLGTEDPEVPVGTARAFCDAIVDAGGRCDLALYDGARHGFFNPGRAGGRHFDDTNARVLAFLRELGVLDAPGRH